MSIDSRSVGDTKEVINFFQGLFARSSEQSLLSLPTWAPRRVTEKRASTAFPPPPEIRRKDGRRFAGADGHPWDNLPVEAGASFILIGQRTRRTRKDGRGTTTFAEARINDGGPRERRTILTLD